MPRHLLIPAESVCAAQMRGWTEVTYLILATVENQDWHLKCPTASTNLHTLLLFQAVTAQDKGRLGFTVNVDTVCSVILCNTAAVQSSLSLPLPLKYQCLYRCSFTGPTFDLHKATEYCKNVFMHFPESTIVKGIFILV